MRHGSVDKTADAFAKAAHVVALDIVNQRLAPAPMEPRGINALFDNQSGRLTVRISSQMPTGVRGSLCDAIPVGRVPSAYGNRTSVGGPGRSSPRLFWAVGQRLFELLPARDLTHRKPEQEEQFSIEGI